MRSYKLFYLNGRKVNEKEIPKNAKHAGNKKSTFKGSLWVEKFYYTDEEFKKTYDAIHIK